MISRFAGVLVRSGLKGDRAESSASEASVRIQLEGAIPEILSGRFGINTLAKDLSILRDGTLTSLT